MEGWSVSQSGRGTMAIKPERLSVTVQKAAKASYMSECGQGLNREVKRKSKCYIVVLYKIHV